MNEAKPEDAAPDPKQLEIDRVTAALLAPFASAEVKWKPKSVSGNRALAMPFVDARVVLDRLDDVLGVLNWQDSYEVLPDGAVVCRLKIRINGEWITKEDVGGESEQPDGGDRRKASFSDALKRAAVKFGVGRFLYRQKAQWVDYDPQKRQFVRQPTLLPAAPAEESPRQKAQATVEAARQGQPAAPWHVLLRESDGKLAGKGLCKSGDLVRAVAAMGKARGYPADFSAWDEAQIKAASELANAFRDARVAAAAPAKQTA